MAVTVDKCTTRVRVRDAREDDVKATKIKGKAKKIKRKIKHMSTIYGDVPNPKSNLDLCTNPVGVPILGRVMLDPLQSRSLLALFSTTKLGIQKCSSLGLDLLSLFLWYPDDKREPINARRKKNEGFYR